MAYLIIGVVVVLALAPLWHMMPSPGQRRVAKLREAAALAGLFVEFRDLPLSPERSARLSTSERQVLYYGLRLPASRGEPRNSVQWERVSGSDWRSKDRSCALPEAVAALPAAVLAVGLSEASCGLYWREEGSPEEVDDFAQVLKAWSEKI